MLPGVGVFGTGLTARVIALWGRTQEEAEELAQEMNVPFYTNLIDAVINLPPPLTRQIAVKTLGESGPAARVHPHHPSIHPSAIHPSIHPTTTLNPCL
uniref:Uncharacterized protein n=1 Tax=Salarias fasciatus TaxID=181472 RepID=A0A672HWK5_SALFA